MEALTRNNHGYEFELMPHVVVQYDASFIAGNVHVDGSAVIINAPTAAKALEASKALNEFYDDEMSVQLAIVKHFKSVN